jgi:hypothetical protein
MRKGRSGFRMMNMKRGGLYALETNDPEVAEMWLTDIACAEVETCCWDGEGVEGLSVRGEVSCCQSYLRAMDCECVSTIDVEVMEVVVAYQVTLPSLVITPFANGAP